MVELLVCLVVASILVLTIGVLSDIAMGSHKKARTEAEIYHEIAYGFKLMQNRMHETGSISTVPAGGSWLSDRLVLGDEAFGLYQNTSTRDWVHLPDKDDTNNRSLIFSVKNSDPIPVLNFIFPSSNSVTINFSGQRDGTSFNMSSTVRRRSG